MKRNKRERGPMHFGPEEVVLPEAEAFAGGLAEMESGQGFVEPGAFDMPGEQADLPEVMSEDELAEMAALEQMLGEGGGGENVFGAAGAGVGEADLERFLAGEREFYYDQERLAGGQRMLERQMAEIALLDPSIGGFADLAAMPTFDVFDRLVSGGQDLVSAYKLANFDALTRRGGAAARQAAINSVKSKGHLGRMPAGGAGDGLAEIPPSALALWEEMFPGESRAKLRARYNRAAGE